MTNRQNDGSTSRQTEKQKWRGERERSCQEILRDMRKSVWSIFCHNQSGLYWCFLYSSADASTYLVKQHALWCRHVFTSSIVIEVIYIFRCFVQNNLDVISQLFQLKMPRLNFAIRCVTDRLYPSGYVAQIVMSWPVRVTCHRGQVNPHQSLPRDFITRFLCTSPPWHILHNVITYLLIFAQWH